MSASTLYSPILGSRKSIGWSKLLLRGVYLVLFLGAFEGLRRAIIMLVWLTSWTNNFGDHKVQTLATTAVVAAGMFVGGVVCALLFLTLYFVLPGSRTAAVVAMSFGLYAWCIGLFLNGVGLLVALPSRVAGAVRDGGNVLPLIETTVSILFVGALSYICIKMLYTRAIQAPGVPLTKMSQPELWDFLEQTAAACGVRLPSEVYWLPNANAQVMHFGSWIGAQRRTALAIGLPLLRLLSVDELRATLAHEFHHLRGGDAVVFSCIYQARRNAVDIQDGLEPTSRLFGGLSIGFLAAYSEVLWALSRPIVRKWEFEADLFAAHTVSPGSIARSLVKLELAKWRFEAFRKNWVLPAMESGFLPPVLDAFWEFYEDCSSNPRNLGRLLAAHEGHQKSETHPPLRERLLHISQVAGFSAILDDKPAFSLITRPQLVEAEVYKPPTGEAKQIVWDKGVLKAVIEKWSRNVTIVIRKGSAAEEMGSLERMLRSLPETAKLIGYDKRASEAVERFLFKAFAVSLNTAGWEPAFERGRLIFRKGGIRIDPAIEMLEIKIGRLTDWSERCKQLSIDRLVLLPEPGVPTNRVCPRCMRHIPLTALRCSHCGKYLSA